MKVQLLYFHGCPNWTEAEANLRQALAGADASSTRIEHVFIDSPEQAERWGFTGSPTILINGRDPFEEPGASVGLSCRIYITDDGLAGAPTQQQLTDVLATSE